MSWRPLKKIAGSASESGSISQRYGSADPDSYQNFIDPQHCLVLIVLSACARAGMRLAISFRCSRLVAVLSTGTDHTLSVTPVGWIRGQEGEQPSCIQFQSGKKCSLILVYRYTSRFRIIVFHDKKLGKKRIFYTIGFHDKKSYSLF